jgi:DedD protein
MIAYFLKSFALALMVMLTGAAWPQDTETARKKCVEFGFKSNTTQHSECVRQFLQSSGAGNSLNSADVGNRYVVQVGAFADAARAQEVRMKVERAGLKTYTHLAETKEGRRTRVRVGPFATEAEAESAAEKIRRLELPATVLTL